VEWDEATKIGFSSLLFQSEMAKFGPSVVGLLAVKQGISMLKTKKNLTKKMAPKMIAVIKNGHTEAEMDDMEERWANHQGPYLTLAEVLAIEKAKQA
jgi:hypothetical protein